MRHRSVGYHIMFLYVCYEGMRFLRKEITYAFLYFRSILKL